MKDKDTSERVQMWENNFNQKQWAAQNLRLLEITTISFTVVQYCHRHYGTLQLERSYGCSQASSQWVIVAL